MGFILAAIGIIALILISFVLGFISAVYIIAVKSEEILSREDYETFNELSKKLFDY